MKWAVRERFPDFIVRGSLFEDRHEDFASVCAEVSRNGFRRLRFRDVLVFNNGDYFTFHLCNTTLIGAFPFLTMSIASFTLANGMMFTTLSILRSAAKASIAFMSLLLPT
jgi:hypothetical protein